MTDRTLENQGRAMRLAAEDIPGAPGEEDFTRELRLAFVSGYLARVAEDDEPEDPDTVLACYHASGGFEVVRRVSTAQAGSICRWAMGGDNRLVSWASVLGRGFVRRVKLVES